MGEYKHRGRSNRTTRRIIYALLCALMLAMLSGSLLNIQSVNAAGLSTFYGIPDGKMLAALATDTPTSTATDTPMIAAATATDTPVVAAATATDTPTATATATTAPTATPQGSATTLDVAAAATAAGWPQTYSNWCGIATVALVANYLGNSISQQSIYYALNLQSSESIWGYPGPSSSYYGPYVAADISGDFGTDPRSLAEGMTLATGRLYHVKVDTSGAWDTTIHIVRDMLISRQPISVFVDHGMHSVIVSGVDVKAPGDDPIANPSSITAIHVWDPGGGINAVGIQSTMKAIVPLSTWLSGTIAWSGSVYLKYPYAANIYNGRALDPDPAVGPYAYVSTQVNHLWIGHNVYISPLASADSANLSPDWELNQYGTLIAGLPSSNWPNNIPDGYTGPTVPMPTNPPPPPPPVKPPVVAPKRAPLPPPRPTPTPRPSPTATTLPTATLAPTEVPTATSQATKTACAPINCAMAAVGGDSGLLLVSLLLLVLMVMWFPAAIVVARWRMRRAQRAKSAIRTTQAADDGAMGDDAMTLGDVPRADGVSSDAPGDMPGDILATEVALDTPDAQANTPDEPDAQASTPEVIADDVSPHTPDDTAEDVPEDVPDTTDASDTSEAPGDSNAPAVSDETSDSSY